MIAEIIQYSGVAQLVLSNGVHIDVSELPNKLVHQIKKLAVFKNSEFYTTQAMRFSTWNIPRVIATFDEVDDILTMPRGLLGQIIELLKSNNIEYIITDNTNRGKKIKTKFVGELRSNQKQAVNALTGNDHGVIAAATGFGKRLPQQV